ncbi:hypothetical protein Hanom_Chr12g01129941 [Helianthus anomalus]
MAGMETYLKNDLHAEFIEWGYEGQMVGATLFKPKFPPAIKFFFHTLLVCLSTKIIAFNEILLKTKYLGYVILRNSNHKLSQTLFLDLVANLRAIKKGTCNPFLICPRLLSFYLKKHLKKESFEKGEALQSNSLSNETFIRMMEKGQENVVSENVLENQATNVTTSIAEPTAPGDHGAHSNIVEPTPEISIKTTSISIPKSKRKTTNTVSLGVETPEIPVAAQKQQTQTSVVTSSQQMQISPPIQTPHSSSQKENIVSTGDTNQGEIYHLIISSQAYLPRLFLFTHLHPLHQCIHPYKIA